MDPGWTKRLRKKLKPRGIAFDKLNLIYNQAYNDQYIKKPPPGFMEWDKEALNETQQRYMTDQLTEIVKKNQEYLYYHPQILAILVILIRSFAKYQPRDVRKHMKQVLQDSFLPGKANMLLLDRGFRKSTRIKNHDDEAIEDAEEEQKHYEGQKKFIECFRSELPMTEETKECFKQTKWKEPYPDYIIRKSKTLRVTCPHYIKHGKQFYPMKPPF